jgi:hypothetical protein
MKAAELTARTVELTVPRTVAGVESYESREAMYAKLFA